MTNRITAVDLLARRVEATEFYPAVQVRTSYRLIVRESTVAT